MKKKLTTIPVCLLIISLPLFADGSDNNPFKHLGYKMKIATLTDNNEEFHDQEDVVEIGQVLFDTRKKEIVGFVGEKDHRIELKTDVISTSIDPHCEKYPWITPYAYCLNNPVRFVDPDGKDPIYDPDGNFLGTDDLGLKGDPIVMSVENFKQGMENKKAISFHRDLNNEDAYKKVEEHHKGLPSRPDYDGELTLKEANEWYRNGNGEALFVDASKIDLSPATTKDLKLNKPEPINFASPLKPNLKTGLVYGTLLLTLTNENTGTVVIGKNNKIDEYDFDHQKGRFFRNIATKIGEKVAGKGTSYIIYGYGLGSVKVKK